MPQQHPLRAIRPLVNAALDRLPADFAAIYSDNGRHWSISYQTESGGFPKGLLRLW